MAVTWNGATHPWAEKFPMLGDEELKALAHDIAANGLRRHIILTPDGTLLDGRNRHAACQLASVEPSYTVHHGDPVAFIVSENIHRRHLTTGQRAMLALEVEAHYAETADKGGRPRNDEEPPADLPEVSRRERESREKAAAVVGTSGRAVAQAKRVATAAPDLARKVETGELALDRAERMLRDRENEAKRAEQKRIEAAVLADGPAIDLRFGDFRDVLADVTDLDAIITDPPYPREFLPLLDDLAKWADAALKPDGILAVMMGQAHLPEVYRRLDGHRPYLWTAAYLTPGGQAVQFFPGKVNTFWKPVILYGAAPKWFGDVARSDVNDNDKRMHHWGQSESGMADLIDRLTLPGDTVCDPFVGAGTTLVAAAALGRHCVGAELDEGHYRTTAERLGL